MVGYPDALRLERLEKDLSWLAEGLRLPWVSIVFLVGFTIEGMLAARLWLMMTSAGAITGLAGALVALTNPLVAPYEEAATTPLIAQATGVFEFSTLLAIEAYLLGTLAVILVIASLRLTLFAATKAIAAKRRHDMRSPTAPKGSVAVNGPASVAVVIRER